MLTIFHDLLARAQIDADRAGWGWVHTDRATIARRNGVSEWQARRAVADLIGRGWLRIVRTGPGRGRRQIAEIVGFEDWCRTKPRGLKPLGIPAHQYSANSSPSAAEAPADSHQYPASKPDPFLYIGKKRTTTTRRARERAAEEAPSAPVVVVTAPPHEKAEEPAELAAVEAPQEAPASPGPERQEDETPSQPAGLAEAPAPARDDVDDRAQALVDLWNASRYRELGSRIQGPVCETTPAHRQQWQALRTAAQTHDLAYWEALFLRIAGTKLLRGETSTIGWQASLAWAVGVDKDGVPNRTKVLSGQYGMCMLVQKPSINTLPKSIPDAAPKPVCEPAEIAPPKPAGRVTLNWALYREPPTK